MIGKVEILEKMDEFLEHYDKMDTEAHNRQDKKTEQYALSMWCVFRSLKGKINGYFREHKYAKGVREQKVFEILEERKAHYLECMNRDLESKFEFQKSLYEDHKATYDCCPMAEKRLRTWMKNREGGQK